MYQINYSWAFKILEESTLALDLNCFLDFLKKTRVRMR